MTYLGVPYVWGGESYGGVDCSGLTMLAWESAGVDLPHLSRAQYGYGTHVSLGDMEAGDLIFWSSDGTQSGIYHVALYLGDGEMIEAPTRPPVLHGDVSVAMAAVVVRVVGCLRELMVLSAACCV